MHDIQTIVTNVHGGVCQSVLSCGSVRLHCAKAAEQIKMLFGVNTPVGPWNIVLDSVPDPPTERGSWGKFLPIVDPLHISGMATAI